MPASLRSLVSRVVVSSESLPTRLSDLRFLVLESLDALHVPSGEVPLASDLTVRVVERGERTVIVEARYRVVDAGSVPTRDAVRQIRALDIPADSTTVEIPGSTSNA